MTTQRMNPLFPVLHQIAQQHGLLVPEAVLRSGNVHALADFLAANGIVVIMGELTSATSNSPVPDAWVNAYLGFYRLLAQNLFAPFIGIRARVWSHAQRPLLELVGQTAPIMQVMGGTVVPYIAMRQGHTVFRAELEGMMRAVIKKLTRDKLPDDLYQHLLAEGASAFLALLELPLRQHNLTTPDAQLRQQMARRDLARRNGGSVQTSRSTPTDLPEELLRKRNDIFNSSIPNFIPRSNDSDNGNRRRPPVPPFEDER